MVNFLKRKLGKQDRDIAKRGGLINGLISATFSTLFISLGARRVGRDAKQDWMEVGTVLLRGRGVSPKPRWGEVLAGLVVHQSADIFWALVYHGFGIGRMRSGSRRQAALLTGAVPWAVATAAIEYYLILPWLQPVLRMQVPFWTACSVHLSSGAAYPLYPWIEERLRGEEGTGTRMGKKAAMGLGAGLAVMVGLALWVRRRGEPRWPLGSDQAKRAQRRFLRHMTAHHEVGVRLSELAVARARQRELHVLGRLMLADHHAELDVMRDWWRSWYGGQMPGLTAQEYEAMRGMPAPEHIQALEALDGDAFEARFLPIMIEHHQGAVAMADEAWQQAADPRVRLFADSIRHAQRGQIAWMKRLHRQLLQEARRRSDYVQEEV